MERGRIHIDSVQIKGEGERRTRQERQTDRRQQLKALQGAKELQNEALLSAHEGMWPQGKGVTNGSGM